MRRKIGILLILSMLFLVATQIQAQQPIKVKIKSNPGGATVYLDDRFIGRTPLTTQIAEGKHNIKLDYKEGYITIDKDILVTPKNNSFHYAFRMTGGKKFETAAWILVLVLLVASIIGGGPV